MYYYGDGPGFDNGYGDGDDLDNGNGYDNGYGYGYGYSYSYGDGCGRGRGYMGDCGLCRICFRELANEGKIPGVKKSSW